MHNEYERHARAAQAFAGTTFSPPQVLRPLLEKIL
jgi:hypothetical protein